MTAQWLLQVGVAIAIAVVFSVLILLFAVGVAHIAKRIFPAVFE